MSWWLEACGYLGLGLSVLFGANQLRLIWRQGSDNVSLLDFAMRVVYSGLLGLYAGAKGETLFVIANVAAALFSAAVAGTGWWQRSQRGDRSSKSE